MREIRRLNRFPDKLHRLYLFRCCVNHNMLYRNLRRLRKVKMNPLRRTAIEQLRCTEKFINTVILYSPAGNLSKLISFMYA